MKTYTSIVVDDEPHARDELVEVLDQFPEIRVKAICRNGLEAIRMINHHRPDLLFLDIEMPEIDGFQVLDNIEYTPYPSVVFVTAYNEYAVKAFEVEALDYIHKPFKVSRVAKTIERIKKNGDRIKPEQVDRLKSSMYEERYLDRFILKDSGEYFMLSADDIHYIQSDGNYLHIHTSTDSYMVRHTLSGMNDKLDPEKFFRISQSNVVNADRVSKIEKRPYGGYLVTLTSGHSLKMSTRYKRLLDSYATI